MRACIKTDPLPREAVQSKKTYWKHLFIKIHSKKYFNIHATRKTLQEGSGMLLFFRSKAMSCRAFLIAEDFKRQINGNFLQKDARKIVIACKEMLQFRMVIEWNIKKAITVK